MHPSPSPLFEARAVPADVLHRLTAHGWRLGESPEFRGPSGHVSWILARRADLRIILLEMPIGQGLPDRSERRRHLREISRRAMDLLVFCDAARTEFVWCLQEAVGDELIYGEYRTPGAEPALLEALTRVSDPDSSQPRCAGRAAGGAAADGHGGTIPSGGGGISGLITETEGSAELREWWRRIGSTVVLDLDCRDAAWLISCGFRLEAAYAACLNRMQESVTEADRERRRRSYLRDFRDILRLANDRRFNPSRTVWLRRLIVQRHLLGFATEEVSARRTRTTLLEFAGWNPGRSLPLDSNIRVAETSPRLASVGSAALEEYEAREESREDREALRAAWRMVADQRLQGDGAFAEFKRAGAQLEDERKRLLGDATAAAGGDANGFRVPDLLIEFPILARFPLHPVVRERRL